MKKIYLLLGLSAMLFIVGCSKDNVTDPVSTSSTNTSVDKDVKAFAKSLYEKQTDALDAATSIKTKFPYLTQEAVVDVTYQVGYSPGDLIRILNEAFKENPKETERILMGILTNYTSPQIAELIIKGYKDYLLNHEDDLMYLISKFPEFQQQIMLLSIDFNKSFEQILALLHNKQPDMNLVDFVSASEGQFHLDAKTISKILRDLKISPTWIAKVLKENFNMSFTDAAKTLKELGMNLKEIYSGLKDNYDFKSVKTVDLANILVSLGFDKDEVYKLFGCHR